MRKIDFDFIPPHEKCNNCGECCGPVPISQAEYVRILKYCTDNKIKPIENSIFECIFRDNKNKICLIYPVRPSLCKIFGVAKDMECVNGNTYEIDMIDYINKDGVKNLKNLVKLKKELTKGDK